MRTIGEIDRDARGLALLRRCADALDAIACTLAAIHDAMKPPMFVKPKEVLEDGTLIYPAPGELSCPKGDTSRSDRRRGGQSEDEHLTNVPQARRTRALEGEMEGARRK